VGKVVLIRNEREWQQCWEVALKEDDHELELDIVQLNPADILPDEPQTPSPPMYTQQHRVSIHGGGVEKDAAEQCVERMKMAGTHGIGANWTDDESDDGDDGPGRSPDVEMSMRSSRHSHDSLTLGRVTPADTLSHIHTHVHDHGRLGSDRSALGEGSEEVEGVVRSSLGTLHDVFGGLQIGKGGGGSRAGSRGSGSVGFVGGGSSSRESGSVGTEQAREDLAFVDASVGYVAYCPFICVA